VARLLIQAGHIIAFQDGQHRRLVDGVIVIEDDRILHVGKSYDGAVDERVNASSMIVTPGLINTHIHVTGSPLDKSFLEDRGDRQFYMGGGFEYLAVRGDSQDEDSFLRAADFSFYEILRTGTTTFCEIGRHGRYVAGRAGELGLRVYVGEGFREGRYYTPDGKQVLYEWNPEAGWKDFEKAKALIREIDGSYDGRIRGLVSPMQVDTCSGELLIEARKLADQLGLPVTLHVSQSVIEFQEMIRRHGLSPIEWLHSIGFLGPNVILGHAIIIGGSSWAQFKAPDIRLMAESGTSVAHAPWVFARRGIAMESFARYLAAGVNMTLGTDTHPQSMLEAMRWAAVISKIIDRDTNVATAADVFNAATIGGAKALGRGDLGIISPGAKADLLFWDGRSLFMTPLRDPIKNIVFSAQAEDLRDVMIDGKWVMRDAQPIGMDLEPLLEELQAAAERLWKAVPEHDWAGRSINELSPHSFPEYQV
jgi:5-methylthioadenosine/S-adenosylhomocysteine deaminase